MNLVNDIFFDSQKILEGLAANVGKPLLKIGVSSRVEKLLLNVGGVGPADTHFNVYPHKAMSIGAADTARDQAFIGNISISIITKASYGEYSMTAWIVPCHWEAQKHELYHYSDMINAPIIGNRIVIEVPPVASSIVVVRGAIGASASSFTADVTVCYTGIFGSFTNQ